MVTMLWDLPIKEATTGSREDKWVTNTVEKKKVFEQKNVKGVVANVFYLSDFSAIDWKRSQIGWKRPLFTLQSKRRFLRGIFFGTEADFVEKYFLVLIDEMQKRKIVFKKWRTSLLLVFKSTGITRRDPKLIQSILSRLGFKTFIGYRWKKDHRLSHRYLRLTPWNTLPRRCHSPLRTKVLVSPSPLSTKSNWNSKFIMMSCGTAASNLQPAMKSSYAYSCHCCGC